MRRIFLSLIAAIGLSATASAAPEIGKAAPNFKAKDIAGYDVDLSTLKGHVVVLEWTNPACPYVQKFYSLGAMQALQAEMNGKGVSWISINSSATGKHGSMTSEETQTFLADAKSNTDHYILDSDGTIGALYGAKTTPHMFVIDAKGDLAYMGAIDNKPTTNVNDLAPARNYVRDAVDALLAEKPVKISSTQAYGCAVQYKQSAN